MQADAKPLLSVSFHNFWDGFDPKSFFYLALCQRYQVELTDAGRDVQISSVFGNQPLPSVPGARPLRIWFTGEAMDPRGQLFDLHFGFYPTSILGSRWYRLPLWVIYVNWWDPKASTHVGRLLQSRSFQVRKRFCNFIYSNDVSLRAEFFLRLNALRPVDSVGEVLNNRDGWRPMHEEGKRKYLSQSQFTIAFENHLSPGYVTEKLVQPLLEGSIPIYWGAPEAKTDFNPESFIFAADHGSMDDLVRHVIRVADSREALEELCSASPFPGNKVTYEHTPDFFVDRVHEALSSGLASRMQAEWRQPFSSQQAVAQKQAETQLEAAQRNEEVSNTSEELSQRLTNMELRLEEAKLRLRRTELRLGETELLADSRRRRVENLQEQLRQVINSTSWKLLQPIHRLAGRHAYLRRLLRGTLHMGWRIITGRLRERLVQRTVPPPRPPQTGGSSEELADR